jgi:hypothetical protein
MLIKLMYVTILVLPSRQYTTALYVLLIAAVGFVGCCRYT